MKEQYFNKENLEEKAENWLWQLEPIKRRLAYSFEVKNSALLVIDMQSFFLDKSSHACVPGADAIIPNIKKLVDGFIGNGRPVVFTRHIDYENSNSMMKKWWQDSIKEENTLSEIIPELSRYNTTVIIKSRYDAFLETNLDDFLKSKDVSQLVITGVLTNLCCETTARAAFTRGYFVFFPVDCTATYNETFHMSALYNLSHGFAIPVTGKDILRNLEAENEA